MVFNKFNLIVNYFHSLTVFVKPIYVNACLQGKKLIISFLSLSNYCKLRLKLLFSN